MGYVVFKLGDLNRRPRYWSRILERSIGVGYDRIVYPPAVVLLRSWRGAKSGSDHRPLIGEFRFRDS
jgi:endonuclease/exonuclease/phosphatase (EEP) superfamily protein YafD